jgi:tRNA A37 threonylcarbamoyladenosine dehydratase
MLMILPEDFSSRTRLLLGAAGLDQLASTSIAIFGIGGVGSYAVEALARAGVGHLTLIDFDVVAISNLNRQVHALTSTVGRPKAEVMAERCRQINPALQVTVLTQAYDADSAERLLAPRFDYVLDCIDLITAKLHLIAACKQQQLPLLSAMGAANKWDPTAIRVGDLFATKNCRLARIMRKELRRRGVTTDVEVVYSTEGFRPLGGGRRMEADSNGGYQQRRAPLGSVPWIPSIFGLTMVGTIIPRLLASKGFFISPGDDCE